MIILGCFRMFTTNLNWWFLFGLTEAKTSPDLLPRVPSAAANKHHPDSETQSSKIRSGQFLRISKKKLQNSGCREFLRGEVQVFFFKKIDLLLISCKMAKKKHCSYIFFDWWSPYLPHPGNCRFLLAHLLSPCFFFLTVPLEDGLAKDLWTAAWLWWSSRCTRKNRKNPMADPNYPVIWEDSGVSSSFSRKIHHPWWPLHHRSPNITGLFFGLCTLKPSNAAVP